MQIKGFIGLVLMGTILTGMPFTPAWAKNKASSEADTPLVNTSTFSFTAYSMDDRPLYTGEYMTGQDANGHIVETQEYRTSANEQVYRMVSVFNPAHMKPVRFNSVDFRHGNQMDGTMVNDRFSFSITNEKGQVIDSGERDWEESVYLWPNIIHVVEKNWEHLFSGQTVDLRLFVVSRNDHYRFTLKKTENEKKDGPGRMTISFKPASTLLSLILSPIRFTFVRENGADLRLVEYSGKSAFRNSDGKSEDLRIVLHAQRLVASNTGS